MGAAVSLVDLRRAIVSVNVIFVLAWIAYAVVFIFEGQGRVSTSIVPLAASFTAIIGVLLFTAFGLYVAYGALHRRRLRDGSATVTDALHPQGASHYGWKWTFFLVNTYIYAVLVTLLWRFSSRYGDVDDTSDPAAYDVHANIMSYGLSASGTAFVVTILAVASASGAFNGTPPDVEWLETRVPHKLDLSAYPPSSARGGGATPVNGSARHRRYPFSSGVAAAAPTMGSTTSRQQPVATLLGNDAASPSSLQTTRGRHVTPNGDFIYQYVFSPHHTIRKWHFLSVVTYLTGIFLFVMGFLALLQSQQIAAIPNLWVFAICYGTIGLVLVFMQIFGVIAYARKHPELTYDHMLTVNVNVVVMFFTWVMALSMLATWLGMHAPGVCCDADAAVVVPGDEPAWALYNNALLVVATGSLTPLATFVAAVTVHQHPSRRDPLTYVPRPWK